MGMAGFWGFKVVFLKALGRINALFVLYLACSLVTLALVRNAGEPGSLPCFARGAESRSQESSLTAPAKNPESGESLFPLLTPSFLYTLFKCSV